MRGDVTANAGDTENPGEEQRLFLGICGAVALVALLHFGTACHDGILNSLPLFARNV